MDSPGSAFQQGPLLKTKLYLPPARPTWVSRPRLIERLNEGIKRKLTLISAPAGFGKTTLLSEWVNQGNRRAVWVSLDESANDAARFLAYIVAALQTIEPELGQTALNMLQAGPVPRIQPVLTILLNEMAGIPDHLALILDDYHMITAEPVHAALTFLLDHLPPQLHVVIATRADPPLPISRLRAHGELIELRQTDLCFTDEEAATFLNQTMQLKLLPGDVAVLAARTEGWIAGLQMAAISMRDRRDIANFIAAFAGGQHHVPDYLAEEVLQRQPEHVQSFLLKTSILNRMSGPLCDAVIGSPPMLVEASQAMLEHLEHANLFVVPLDDQLHWYRYHHLFADLLRNRLQLSQPELVSVLHRRASEWYAQKGFFD